MDELETKRFEKHSQHQINDDFFEQELEAILNIDVPDNLADKILLNQRTNPSNRFYSYKPAYAIAASACLVVFLFFQTAKIKLTDIALEHVYHELDHLVASDQPWNKNQILSSIEGLGLNIRSLPDDISYAGQCMIGDKKGVHIVARVNNNPVTIFLSKNSIDKPEYFNDNRFFGEIYPTANGSLIIIGESSDDLTVIREQTNAG